MPVTRALVPCLGPVCACRMASWSVMNDRPGPTGAGHLGPSRRRVLACLQQAAEPLTVEVLAHALEMHPNSVRFHVAALLADGLIRSLTHSRPGPGRPPISYTADPASPTVGGDHYRELALVLAGHVAADSADPEASARRAGERWGRQLAASRPGVGDDLAGLIDTLRDVGFSCRLVGAPSEPELQITRCPYREVAQAQQEVICTLHLGAMRGYLDAIRSAYRVTALEPWAQEDLCLARFEGTPRRA